MILAISCFRCQVQNCLFGFAGSNTSTIDELDSRDSDNSGSDSNSVALPEVLMDSVRISRCHCSKCGTSKSDSATTLPSALKLNLPLGCASIAHAVSFHMKSVLHEQF